MFSRLLSSLKKRFFSRWICELFLRSFVLCEKQKFVWAIFFLLERDWKLDMLAKNAKKGGDNGEHTQKLIILYCMCSYICREIEVGDG